MFSAPWSEKLILRGSICDHFPQKGLAWTATWDRLFRKELNFEKPESQKMSKIVRELAETGSEKWSGGVERSGRVKIALRIHWEASRSPKTFFRNSKKAKNLKINDFPYFSYFPVWALLALFSLFGVTRCSHATTSYWNIPIKKYSFSQLHSGYEWIATWGLGLLFRAFDCYIPPKP